MFGERSGIDLAIGYLLMENYLRERKVVKPLALNLPRLKGTDGNPSIA